VYLTLKAKLKGDTRDGEKSCKPLKVGKLLRVYSYGLGGPAWSMRRKGENKKKSNKPGLKG